MNLFKKECPLKRYNFYAKGKIVANAMAKTLDEAINHLLTGFGIPSFDKLTVVVYKECYEDDTVEGNYPKGDLCK